MEFFDLSDDKVKLLFENEMRDGPASANCSVKPRDRRKIQNCDIISVNGNGRSHIPPTESFFELNFSNENQVQKDFMKAKYDYNFVYSVECDLQYPQQNTKKQTFSHFVQRKNIKAKGFFKPNEGIYNTGK